MLPERAERKLAAMPPTRPATVGSCAPTKKALSRASKPIGREHRGRIVKTTGWVEFPAVVDAVRCTVEMQEGMVTRNADLPKDRRIDFRVGINL